MVHEFLRERKWSSVDGIWTENTDTIAVSSAFKDEMQNDLYFTEDNSWWFSYRATAIASVAGCFFDKDVFFLDIGGGNGYTPSVLLRKGFTMGLIEPNIAACRNAKRRGMVDVICGVISEELINDASIKQCMLLDVLEHIPDDKAFLQLLNKKQPEEGRVLLTVPAHEYLWSSEDDFAGHQRRYSKDALRKVLTKAGYEIEYMSYFFWFLILPIFFFRVLLERLHIIKERGNRSKEEMQKLQQVQFERKSGIIDAVLNFCEGLELKRLLNKKEIGFGASLICVARKTK